MEDGPSTSYEESKKLPQLKILEDQLKCHICGDFLKNPVMSTMCSHNFCSYCIRNYLSYKSSCPVCSTNLSDNLLKANRCLEEIILCFHPVKEYILKTGVSEPSAYKGKQLLKATHSNEKMKTNQGTSLVYNTAPAPPTDLNTRKSTGCVPCPNCQGSFFQSQINSHLDTCLKTTPFQSRKLMPKLVYHLIKLAPLKKMLKDLGLSTTGDHATLANRHKKYTIMYNSECDAVNPRSVIELKAQLEEEEAETRRIGESTNLATATRTQPSEAEIEFANKKYLLQHKEMFDRLISDIRSRRQYFKTEIALNSQKSLSEVNKEEKKEIEDDDEIVILETPVKIFETISLIESDDEASIPPEATSYSVSSDLTSQSNSLSPVEMTSSTSPSASSVLSDGTFSGGGDVADSSSYHCPSSQSSINSTTSAELGQQTVRPIARIYTGLLEESDGSLHSPELSSESDDIQVPALSCSSESESSRTSLRLRCWSFDITDKSKSEEIQMPTLSYSTESESIRTTLRISRRSFEITSSETKDFLPEPPAVIDDSSITSLSATNSSTSNLRTSSSPSKVSDSSSASPLSHSDSSLSLGQPVRKSRKRASQSEVTERKMSLRSRKM